MDNILSNYLLNNDGRGLVIDGEYINVDKQTGFVNITAFMSVINKRRKNKGLTNRRIDDILSTKSMGERMVFAARDDESGMIKKFEDSLRKKEIKLQSIHDLSTISLAYRVGKGKEQHWMIHPMVFILIALEADVNVYLDVIRIIDGTKMDILK